ncbi:8e124784-bebf-451b-8c9f-bf33ee2fcef3 [Sclerotinia trifoliorum]|uniref:8e124784-bebf-451b-8c9f-bf33ee2fcef3 n=1 Tax=Sclerotinia trifoliorum TaxID=28548 RepID=A0A8H2VNP5_9HELO|nr:8e124784-bebf-451b-8c9f-bf33ee2fcef3 [Sclerotinia trifoliorum]
MIYSNDADYPTSMPGSPPELTGSKSSKSSSFHSSYQSDNDEILSDVNHFEEIGLDDESRLDSEIGDFAVKMSTNPYSSSFTTDLRSQAKQQRQQRVPMSATQGNTRIPRDLTSNTKGRSGFPTLRSQIRSAASDGLAIVPVPTSSARTRRGMSNPNAPALPTTTLTRQRSLSPNISASPRSSISGGSAKGRRGSWVSNRERKTTLELERECDEDDGDDVPDECLLENVPISPRPPQERRSAAPSASTSPERPAKEKSKPLGNGTSAKPAEQGELRSPRAIMTRGATTGQFPTNLYNSNKPRAKSWNEALSDLSEEAKALTEALEAHAEDEERNQSFSHNYVRSKPTRVKSSFAELPPLRRTELMIDPLPISKEKEAVLSRTRPSWLPPKDPAEERRHLKEYQKMMALAEKVERKKESEKNSKSACRDDTASSLLRIWEEHVLPNWDDVIRQRRTRELWWRGIAPRSRGAVWTKAIGNPLGLSEPSYTAALRRAQALEATIKNGSQLSAEEEKKRGWLERIEKDVKETYPELRIFQPEGPLHVALTDVLKAYAMYRSDVGYVHGTNTIAAILLLNLPDASSSFEALSNILNRPLPLSFHTNDSGAISRVYSLFLTTLSQKFPRLHSHLTAEDLNLNPDVYLRDTFASLFTSSISLDNASRLWDVVVFEGDSILVRAAVALFGSLENKLHSVTSDEEVLAVLNSEGFKLGEEDWIAAVRGAGKSRD